MFLWWNDKFNDPPRLLLTFPWTKNNHKTTMRPTTVSLLPPSLSSSFRLLLHLSLFLFLLHRIDGQENNDVIVDDGRTSQQNDSSAATYLILLCCAWVWFAGRKMAIHGLDFIIRQPQTLAFIMMVMYLIAWYVSPMFSSIFYIVFCKGGWQCCAACFCCHRPPFPPLFWLCPCLFSFLLFVVPPVFSQGIGGIVLQCLGRVWPKDEIIWQWRQRRQFYHVFNYICRLVVCHTDLFLQQICGPVQYFCTRTKDGKNQGEKSIRGSTEQNYQTFVNLFNRVFLHVLWRRCHGRGWIGHGTTE